MSVEQSQATIGSNKCSNGNSNTDEMVNEMSTTRHVMLSYQWDSQELVLQVYDTLSLLGYRLWMDIKGGRFG